MSCIAIAGAGAFGTALASVQAAAGRRVVLWGRSASGMAAIARSRENPRLPGVQLSERIEPTSDPALLVQAEAVLIAVPTQGLRGFLGAVALPPVPLVLLCKGMERGSGLLPSEVLADALPGREAAVLTGPGFADEIAAGKPTALTVAAARGVDALQRLLATSTLRPYSTDDLIGAQIGGAMKNVIAIACGVTIGAGLGESARAAVLTRGFAEMQRFAATRGARAETLSGLSGLGDLALTATSERSRNYAFGLALGAGRPPRQGVTVEGVASAQAFAGLPGLDLPITATVAALVEGALPVRDAVTSLLSRPLKPEA